MANAYARIIFTERAEAHQSAEMSLIEFMKFKTRITGQRKQEEDFFEKLLEFTSKAL